MDYPITKRMPCAVCGFDSFSRHGWFLVAENRWLDRLRIFAWHPSLASKNGFQSLCGRQHLNVLIGYWLEQADLCLLSSAKEAFSTSHDLGDQEEGYLGATFIGEICVYREGSSQAWTGSSATLESILDALIPPTIEAPTRPAYHAQSQTAAFQLFSIPQASSRAAPTLKPREMHWYI
jgi:hypothetical protein